MVDLVKVTVGAVIAFTAFAYLMNSSSAESNNEILPSAPGIMRRHS